MRRVVVAGGGQVAILTAIGIRRALPRSDVIVIGLPPDRAAFADFAATALPFTNRLHDRLGVEEADLVLKCGASHRLITRYRDWGGGGQAGLLPYGGGQDPALQTRFAQEWGGGPRNVSRERPAGSLSEVLAEAGRFAPPPPDMETPLSRVEYGLRWNPPAYRDLLIGIAQQLGIAHVPGPIAALEPDDAGGIASVAIEGSERIAADLFVDCSGSGAALAAAMPGYARIDWTSELPVRRVLVGKPGPAVLALEDRMSLVPEGWRSELNGRDGVQVSLAMADGGAEDAAVNALGAEPIAGIALSPVRIRDAWTGNVIALGDAAAQFEPLGFLNLDLAHRQLDLLLEMLPGRAILPPERAEYNRRAGLMMDAVRDTLALHYAAPGARAVFGEQAAVPDAVRIALDQFERRGRLPFREEAPFLKQEEMELLTALGFMPGRAPQHGAMDPREVEMALARVQRDAKEALDYAPDYRQWMAHVLKVSATPTG
ncbi:tryptophan 7-halogenase [Qipengyuania sp. JC766]|uniref:tryptophan 7-halogenase n=1 Tax=Qipengyuania sp. JC766 TaxID=3232139 RepID=UPI00345741FE